MILTFLFKYSLLLSILIHFLLYSIFFFVTFLVMSCYPLNHESPEEELQEELETAHYKLSVDGIEFTPVTGRRRTVRRYIFQAFLQKGVFGLDAVSYMFFLSTAYSYFQRALWDEEVSGICRVRNRFNPWTMLETRYCSKWTTELIEFFIGNDVSLP